MGKGVINSGNWADVVYRWPLLGVVDKLGHSIHVTNQIIHSLSVLLKVQGMCQPKIQKLLLVP